MKLLDFLNSHPTDWKEKLAAKPYCLDIKEQNNFVIFKYQMLESDFSRPEVLQARGSIFYHDPNDGHFEPQSIAMYKFFNSTEKYAETANMDWSTVRVLEKCDGSLMKISYDHHNGCFLLSTNGSIYASEAMTQFGISFEEAFIKTIGGRAEYEKLLNRLDPFYTYFFELVSKYNKICVSYDEDRIYYLGRRNMITLKEEQEPCSLAVGLRLYYPREYYLSSYEACQTAIKNLGENQEGFVCVDNNFRRIKMKTPWYIAMHKLRGNGNISYSHLLELWQNDSLDDFMAAFPEYNSMIEEMGKKLNDLIEKADIAFKVVFSYVYDNSNNRRTFARYASTYVKPIQSFLFARLDNKVDCANTYFKNMKPRNLAELLDVKEISVK